MPSSPIQGFSMSDNSTHNSFECTSSIPGQYGESESEMKKLGKYRFNQGHALLRKQMQRPIILQTQKTFGRRRFTFSGHQEQKVVHKKRRRFTSVALPRKFLLGGNINDPLNLGSLQDEKINQQLNAFSPVSSPMPVPIRRTQVQVLIPPNIYDPLNLNTGEDIEFNLLSSKPRKRRRHRKVRKDDEIIDETNDVSPTDEVPHLSLKSQQNSDIYLFSLDDCVAKQFKNKGPKPELPKGSEAKIFQILNLTEQEKIVNDKKVTPAPQGSKTFKKAFFRSISRDVKEKTSAHVQVVKQRKTKVRQDIVKSRANAGKFCYGNHVTNQTNWNSGEASDEDQRLRFLNVNFFRSKDVLDIGCNTGQLSLYIATHYKPKKIIGIDIDKKLINIAQRKVRQHVSKDIERNNDFPASMATLYGSLSKLVMSSMQPPKDFPNNITFLEANYVPASADYLESQKPEYDTILCLRVTKWIHLNFGDEGLKMAFKRMFSQLRYGGVLILEPQPWFTYSASKRVTILCHNRNAKGATDKENKPPAIYKTYQGLQMKPDSFCEYLLSSEVGFSSCRLIGKAHNYTKAYRQDIYLLKKEHRNTDEQNLRLNTSASTQPFFTPCYSPSEDFLQNFEKNIRCFPRFEWRRSNEVNVLDFQEPTNEYSSNSEVQSDDEFEVCKEHSQEHYRL